MFKHKIKSCIASVAGLACFVGAAHGAPETAYPSELHGVWLERGSSGRTACKQFLRNHDQSTLSDAQVVTAERWTDVSEGESSYSTLVSVTKAGTRAWRFVERFHLNGDAESSETKGRARLMGKDSMLQTYEFRDEGATRTATRVLRRCR